MLKTLGIILISAVVLDATPARWVDGKIQFAVATVDGQAVFSQSDKNEAISRKAAYGKVAVVVDLPPPSEFEVNLSTSGLKFKNYTDFKSCAESKDSLDDKISDLPPSESSNIQLDYLVSENLKR